MDDSGSAGRGNPVCEVGSSGITKSHIDSISSALEQFCNPGRLIGVQRGDDLGFTVIDLTSVRPLVIASVEHGLEI